MADESKYESEYYLQQITWFCTIFQDAPWLNECEPLAHVVTALYQSIVEIDELTDAGNQKKGNLSVTHQRGEILAHNLKLALHSGGQSDMSKSRKQRKEKARQVRLAIEVEDLVQQENTIEKSVLSVLGNNQMDSSQMEKVRHYYYKWRKLAKRYLAIRSKAKYTITKLDLNDLYREPDD